MDTRQLRYFAAVADHLHFRRAAEALRTAQPSLSQQIKSLEAELGVQLFDRSKRNVQLTAAGVVYYEEVQRILAQVATAGRRATEASNGRRGRIIFGTSSATMLSFMPEIAARVRADFPDVSLTMRVVHAVELLESMRNRRVHLAFIKAPVADEVLVAEPLWEHPFCVALPLDHPAAAQSHVTFADIAGDVLLRYARTASASIYDEVQALCFDNDFAPVATDDAGATDELMGLVACGCGVAIVPAHWRSIGTEKIAFRPLLSQKRHSLIVSACRHRDEQAPVVLAMIRYAQEAAQLHRETVAAESFSG